MADLSPRMFVLEIELGDDVFYVSDGVNEMFAPEMAVADLLRQAADAIELKGIEAQYIHHIRTGQPIGAYGYKVEEEK